MLSNTLLYIGTYTETIVHGTGTKVFGRGEGIYGAELDPSGVIVRHQLLAHCPNPSYLCLSPDRRFLYAVNELKEYEDKAQGSVSAYRVGEDGWSLTLLGCRPTGGTDPCHVAVSHNGKSVVVSNFMSGSICAYRVEEDGSLSQGQSIQHVGSGPDPLRQAGPHAHAATYSPDDRYVYVPDLGIDQIKIYRVDPDTQLLEEADICHTPPGAGPRYCEKHPNCAKMVCVNELGCSVTSYTLGDGRLTPLSTAGILEEGDPASIAAALHILPNGKYVYASIRGADKIACLHLGEDGALKLASRVESGGKTPRDFSLSPGGHYLIAAHQDSDLITVFAVNAQTGALSPVSRYDMPTPVCVCPY